MAVGRAILLSHFAPVGSLKKCSENRSKDIGQNNCQTGFQRAIAGDLG